MEKSVKMTKRILALALTLMLLLSLSVPAFADGAQYKWTEDYLVGAAQEAGLTCELQGLAKNGNEIVYVTYSGSLSKYVSYFYAYFTADGEEVLLYMPYVITFDEDDLLEVLAVVNELNAVSAGVKLYVDTDECTVDAELYLMTTPETAGSLAFRGSGSLVAFTDDIYELLGEYSDAA
jgi:hypothetical protein